MDRLKLCKDPGFVGSYNPRASRSIRFWGCRDSAPGSRDVSDEVGEERSQLVHRRNIHQQGDVALNLLLADLELDVEKQDERFAVSQGVEQRSAVCCAPPPAGSW